LKCCQGVRGHPLGLDLHLDHQFPQCFAMISLVARTYRAVLGGIPKRRNVNDYRQMRAISKRPRTFNRCTAFFACSRGKLPLSPKEHTGHAFVIITLSRRGRIGALRLPSPGSRHRPLRVIRIASRKVAPYRRRLRRAAQRLELTGSTGIAGQCCQRTGGHGYC
jgi:hypothetical protein